MTNSVGVTLHYRSSFDLIPSQHAKAAWVDAVKAIRSWLSKKTGPDDNLGKRWFFSGGSWKGPKRTIVETARVVGNGIETAPEHWAFRYEHPCAEIPRYRRWRTDIGITAIEPARLRISVTTVHWLLPGFIGQEPLSPLPTAPGIVGTLLRSSNWRAFSGLEQLSVFPTPLNEGDGADFVKKLEATDRICPIVLVTLGFATGKAKLDTHRLAKLLAGSATVYAASSSGVDKELEWLLPKDFRCWNGMVRVYQPGVRLSHEWDALRHRFFTGSDLDEIGSQQVEEILVTGIARRSSPPTTAAVTSVEDVTAKQREARIAELRKGLESKNTQERVGSLEEELGLFEDDNKYLSDKMKTLEAEREQIQDEKMSLEGKVSSLTFERQHFQQQAIEAEKKCREIRSRLQSLDALDRLPESLSEVLDVIENLHAGRIVFTDRARDSAKKTAFSDPAEAWRCLWAMATTLHDLHFDENVKSGNIDGDFKANSGFALALTERGQTKADKKLMALRKDTWDGEAIDITPHVKAGREPNMLRVYYHPHPIKKIIVVGHCGDHLDTSGTRKRK